MIPSFSRRSLDGTYAHQLPKASSQLLASKHTRKVLQTDYLPGNPRFIGELLNTWSEPKLQPIEGAAPNIEALLTHQLPRDDERAHVLNMLAFHVRQPAVKLKHALMIRGPQGSGKNTIFEAILRPILGTTNLRILGSEAFTSRFSSEFVNTQVLVCDEVVQRDGWEIVNRIKPLLSEDKIMTEAKHEARRLSLTPRLIAILSNDRTPLPIEPSDRRFFVPEYGAERLPPEFYHQLYAALDQEVPAFFSSLLTRDIGSFNPNAPPPMTAAKIELQAAVRPPIERQLREWILEREGPFAADIVIPSAVLQVLKIAGYTGVNEGSVSKSLKELGAVPLGQLPKGPWSGRVRCWAVRNHQSWGEVGPAAWASHLAAQTHSTHFRST